MPVWIRSLARLSEIATTLFANGFGWFVRAMRLSACVTVRCRTVCALTHHQCRHHLDVPDSAPERLGVMLEHLGPTFVKLGQLASLRPDFVPLPYAEALRRLQDRAQPMALGEVVQVIEAETGHSPEDLFASFDPDPVASASLSQVHRATLRDGQEVAVKVQRPGVSESIGRDLELVRLMAERLERYSPAARRFHPRRAAAEFAAYTERELDFAREARTMQGVRANMKAEPGIVIPAVHWNLTSRRLLVMEFVAGVRVDDRAGLAALGVDTTEAAERAARAMLRQIFVDGLFHADPHPGNVLLLSGDRVAFLDFGMFGRLNPWLRRRIALAFQALAAGEPERMAEQLIRSASVSTGADVDDYRFALAELVSEWHAGETGLSVAQLLLHELGLGVQYGISYPREMMLVARALVAAEGSAHTADPGLDIAELAERAAGGMPRQLTRSARSVAGGLLGSGGDALELLEELPVLMPRLIDLLEREQIGAPGDLDEARPTAVPGLALMAAGLVAGWTAGGWLAGRRSRRSRPKKTGAEVPAR